MLVHPCVDMCVRFALPFNKLYVHGMNVEYLITVNVYVYYI